MPLFGRSKAESPPKPPPALTKEGSDEQGVDDSPFNDQKSSQEAERFEDDIEALRARLSAATQAMDTEVRAYMLSHVHTRSHICTCTRSRQLIAFRSLSPTK